MTIFNINHKQRLQKISMAGPHFQKNEYFMTANSHLIPMANNQINNFSKTRYLLQFLVIQKLGLIFQIICFHRYLNNLIEYENILSFTIWL